MRYKNGRDTVGRAELTGTPNHIEYLKKAEDDDRRHRSRCIHYEKGNAFCRYFKEKCRGSAHCPRYREQEIKVPSPDMKKDQSPKYANVGNDQTIRVGCKIKHIGYGVGTIMEYTDGDIRVAFEDGKEIVFNLEYALNKGYMIV